MNSRCEGFRVRAVHEFVKGCASICWFLLAVSLHSVREQLSKWSILLFLRACNVFEGTRTFLSFLVALGFGIGCVNGCWSQLASSKLV